MAATRSIMSYSCFFFRYPQRFKPSFVNPNMNLSSSNYQSLSLSIDRMDRCKNDSRMNFVVHNSVQPGVPLPSGNPSHSWKGWVLGMLVSIILPFCRHKLNPFIPLKYEVETVVDAAEFAVDVVEKVAEEIVEIADDLGDKLPQGKLKGVVDMVENIAREIVKDTHLVDDLIDKVEEVEKGWNPSLNQSLTKEKWSVKKAASENRQNLDNFIFGSMYIFDY